MFDLDGRIGDWKFTRVPRAKRMFEPLGNSPGVPDSSSKKQSSDECVAAQGSNPATRTPSASLPVVVDGVELPHGWNFAGVDDHFLTGPCIAQNKTVDGRFLYAVRRRTDGPYEYLLSHGTWNTTVCYVFESVRSAVDALRKALSSEARAKKPVVVQGVELPLGWEFEGPNDPYNCGNVIAHSLRTDRFVVRKSSGECLSRLFGWVRDGRALFSSVADAVAALREALAKEAPKSKDTTGVVGPLELPAGWTCVDRFTNGLPVGKYIAKSVLNSGYLFAMRVLDGSEYEYLTTDGWAKTASLDTYILSLEKMIAFIKKYDPETPA